MTAVRRWAGLWVLSLVITAVAALVVTSSPASAAPVRPAAPAAAAAPVQMNYACTSKATGLVRYVTSTTSCTKAENAVTIVPGPVYLCVYFNFAVRQVAAASDCPSSTFLKEVTLPPTSGPVYFCALKLGGLLTYTTNPSSCNVTLQFPVVVPVPHTVSVTNPGNQTSTVGTAVSLQIQASDSASGQTLTYSATGLPAGLSIASSTGLISGTPTTAGTSSVTVTATDPTGAHGSASFTWTVNVPNTVSVTNPGNQTSTVGTAVSLQIQASDSASGQTLTYSATGLPAGLSIASSTGLISGTPTTAGTSSVTVTATDPTGAHGSASFTWTVNVPNTVSVTNPGNQTSTVGTAVSLQIQASDSASGQTLTYSATGLPAGLSIASSTGLISGTPTTAGTSSVTVTATDPTGAHGSASFTWTVNVPNTVSVTNPGNQTSTVGTAVSLQIQASDSASGQTLTYSATGLPAGLSIASSTGLISGTPTTAGTSSVTVIATDPTGASGSASFTWTINPAAQPPTAQNQSYNAVGNTTLAVGTTVTGPAATYSASQGLLSGDSGDASCGTLSVTGNTTPAHGTVTVSSDGTFTYLPAAGFTGTDTFQYTITCATSGKTASATVTITVGTVVWYVDDSQAAAGTGESNAPFNTLAAANSAAGANSIVFLYQGNATYTGGLTMKSGQDLWGQPHGLTVGSYDLVAPGGTNPVITNSGGNGINLASGVDIEDVNVSGASADGISGSGVTGTVTITDCTITGSTVNNATITDSSGSLNLTVTGSTFSNDHTSGDNDEGLHVDADGTTNATVSVTGSTFTNNNGLSFDFVTDSAASGTNSVTFSDNTISSNIANNGAGVQIAPEGTTTTAITVDGNNIQGVGDDAIGIDDGVITQTSDATLTGTVSGNTVGSPTVAGSGSSGGNDIGIYAEGTGTETLEITSNKLYQYANTAGIYAINREGHPTTNLTITGNTIADPVSTALWGLEIQAGAESSPTVDSGKVCAAITGNSMTGSAPTPANGGLSDFELDQMFGTTIELPGYTGANNNDDAVVSFVQGQNTPSGGTAPSGTVTNNVSGGGGGFINGSCPTP